MKKGSETKIIKRSSIKLNPFNPKNHSQEEVKLQKDDIKRVGYLGGVVWNETSGNLVDGHRRVKAMDIIHKYDGSQESDYEIKVEAVEFDERTEKEQMTYMALANSKADYNLVARYIDDIDYSKVGISDSDIKVIKSLQDDIEKNISNIPDLANEFITPINTIPNQEKSIEEIQEDIKSKPSMSKEEGVTKKQKATDVIVNRQENMDAYVFVAFENVEQKILFCELLEVEPSSNMMVKGEDVLSLIH